MAKFRRGHQHNHGSGIRTVVLLMGVGLVVAGMLLTRKIVPLLQSDGASPKSTDTLDYLPSPHGGEMVFHRYYTLSYLENDEEAQWVAYVLTRDHLNVHHVDRTDWFYQDNSVTTHSAVYHDYSGSSYTRGHLAPAADMAFDTGAMRESFFMSNISPQTRAFNEGIWRELEEQTRDWARMWGRLYVITGPVLKDHTHLEHIGRDKVTVPKLFYKVLLDADLPEIKSIAFLIPNAVSDKPLMDYAVSIDSVEAVTGIDFFPQLQEHIDEGTFDKTLWPVDAQRYQKRVTDWNFR